MGRVPLLAASAAAGLLSIPLWASQAPTQPQFRAAVDLVQVDVAVLDRQRRPVRGLTAADFTVLEDGKPRPVAAFTAVELPPRERTGLGWMSEIAPDVSTNTIPEEGRLVVILLDRTIPDGFPTLNAQAIAKTVVQELGRGDLAAIVFTGGGLPQNFTSDRARLVAAIERSYAASEASPEADEDWKAGVAQLLAELENRAPPTALPALDFSAACHCGACVLEAIGRIADAVREFPRRRKSLMFIGRDMQVETTASVCIDPVRKAREVMFRSLDLASLTVHSFDPGGLETLGPQAGWRGMGYRGRGNLVRQGNISVLPDRTGGRTVLNTNDPLLRVPEILDESDSYYLLGFEPAAADGRRHDIEVKVNRRGLDVRTRREYLAASPADDGAPPPAQAESAWSAIAGVLPARDGVAMTARVSALAVPLTGEPVLAVALHVQHERTASSAMPAPAPASEQVELATGVFTPTGRSFGALRETLIVTPQAGADGVLTYDVLQRIPARPGRYEVRVGLRHQERGQTGSVYAYVDVPDYRKIPFAVSDIGVYAPHGRAALAGSLEDVLLAPPTARRDFDRSERATAFLRLYQMSGSPPTAATLSVRIVDALDRRRYGQDTSFEAGAFTPTGTADYVVNLPLDELETGAYLLTVEAKAGSRSARRDLRFEVR